MSRIVYAVCWLQVTLFAGIWMYQDQQEALGKGIEFNQWDLMTAVTMNTYLLMYDILLLVLLLSIVRIQRDLTDFRLIRFRNTRSALIHSTGRFAKSWGMGLLVYAIVGYLFALQAPAETNWSLAARAGQVFYYPKRLGVFEHFAAACPLSATWIFICRRFVDSFITGFFLPVDEAAETLVPAFGPAVSRDRACL